MFPASSSPFLYVAYVARLGDHPAKVATAPAASSSSERR
jgi:hypothetical protein